MIALVQKVNYASINVDKKLVASIDRGILVFIGVEKDDSEKNAEGLFDKIRKFRIFADKKGKMNLNIEQVKEQILIVPQFTLPAETKKGNRPGFASVADPLKAKKLFDNIVLLFKENTELYIENGVFQADMKVLLENDGPMTFWLKK